MPSTSKSQQRLFGWALACKSGESDNCPANIKKLADSMPAEELEKFAKTKHEGLPDHVEEALEAAAESILEQLELEGFSPITEGINDIMQPPGKTLKNASTELESEKTGRITGEDVNAAPAVDNDKDEKDVIPHVPPGILSAKKEDPTFTPSLFKLPMGKQKDVRRVYDFNEFLKIINYKTQPEITQDGHGQNLTGKNMREGGASTANLPANP
jgi:hypothetical protein